MLVRDSNNIDVYILETPYHLFLFTQIILHKNNFIIIDIHRESQRKYFESLYPFISDWIVGYNYVNDYRVIYKSKFQKLIKGTKHIFKINREVNKFINRHEKVKIQSINYYTPNIFELILINKIKKKRKHKGVEINYIEDGISSYSIQESIFGIRRNFFIRFLFNTNFLNLSMNDLMQFTNNIYLLFPKLTDFDDTLKKRIKILHKGLFNHNLILEYYNLENRFTNCKLVYFFDKNDLSFEDRFVKEYLPSSICLKYHPSSKLDGDNNEFLITEFLIQGIKSAYIISESSTAGIAILTSNMSLNIKFIFLINTYKNDFGKKIDENKLKILQKIQNKFNKRVFIPNNIYELQLLLGLKKQR